MMYCKTLTFSLLGIVPAILCHPVISAFDMSSSVANLNESSAVKKLNLRNRNDKGAVQSDRKLVSTVLEEYLTLKPLSPRLRLLKNKRTTVCICLLNLKT